MFTILYFDVNGHKIIQSNSLLALESLATTVHRRTLCSWRFATSFYQDLSFILPAPAPLQFFTAEEQKILVPGSLTVVSSGS